MAESPSPVPLTTFDPRTARTWAEVDLNRLEGNARALLARFAPPGSGDGVMAVVKADAYGHGAARVAAACQSVGVAHFGVATLAEAVALRQAGVRGDLHVLSPLLPWEMDGAVRADVVPMVSSPEQLDALATAGAAAPLPARCFLKVDTGMGRSGALPDDARALWRRAREAAETVRVVGLATHFSSADETDAAGRAATAAQSTRFAEFLARLAEEEGGEDAPDDGRGGRGLWLSLENSPAALSAGLRAGSSAFPFARGHLVRAGLLLYGIEPYRGALADAPPELDAVLSWRARITLVKELPAGATVGYGRTHTLERPSRIATVAAGYADGLPRRLGNAGHVLLRERPCPIVGRVSMDQCQVDVTDLGPPAVEPGEVVTLIGTDGAASQSVLDIAERVGTTPHEPPCALTARVPRLYVRR